MKTADWHALMHPDALILQDIDMRFRERVGPGNKRIDPLPPAKNGVEWLRDQAFMTLVETAPESRYELAEAWAKQGKFFADSFMSGILAMPHGDRPERGLGCSQP